MESEINLLVIHIGVCSFLRMNRAELQFSSASARFVLLSLLGPWGEQSQPSRSVSPSD